MNSEKNQLLFICFSVAILSITVLIFLFVGGEFKFLFIHFSAGGLLNKISWLVPILLLFIQQIYVIPVFMKGYWKVFSEEPPTCKELFIPMMNEAVIFETNLATNVTYCLWGGIAFLLIIVFTPLLQLFQSGEAVMSVSFYCILLAFFLYIILCVIRGFKYLSVRRAIYDYHNKYLGVRGISPFFMLYQFLYFIPIARSLSILADNQILDKLIKFNDLEQMGTELKEEV